MRKILRSLSLLACSVALVATSAVAAPHGNTPAAPQSKIVVDAASTLGKALKGTAWAVVNSDGTLARGSSITATSQTGSPGDGYFEVDFPKNVNKCVYTATIGSATPTDPPLGFISVSPRSGNAKGVFVETWDSTGAQADQPFNLIVQC